MDIVSQQLKVLQRQLKEAGSDMQRIKELMTAYQDAQTLRNELARRLGSDVIVS
jgi:DNA primase